LGLREDIDQVRFVYGLQLEKAGELRDDRRDSIDSNLQFRCDRSRCNVS
jgi:hypothetical protein